jgi:hypothetical protein
MFESFIKESLMTLAIEEPKVSESVAVSESLDLRLTKTEWIIYWKTKFEMLLQKVVQAEAIIRGLKGEVTVQRKENERLKKMVEEANRSCEELIREKQASLKKKK